MLESPAEPSNLPTVSTQLTLPQPQLLSTPSPSRQVARRALRQFAQMQLREFVFSSTDPTLRIKRQRRMRRVLATIWMKQMWQARTATQETNNG